MILYTQTRARMVTCVTFFISLTIILAGCGGGGGGGGGVGDPTRQMGGAKQGVALALTNPVVSTFVGGIKAGSQDGTGTSAQFDMPMGSATDGTFLYVADANNHVIRKIDILSGAVTTLAGRAGLKGSADGTRDGALFNAPTGVATDGVSLYVADSGNNAIRKIVLATGAVSTLAGSANQVAGAVDGIGSTALFNSPTKLTLSGGNLFVSDSNNNTIRKVVTSGTGTGIVTTLAGTAGQSGSTNGIGAVALYNLPSRVTTDGTNLYVADSNNHTIRQMVIATGMVTTLAGKAENPGAENGIRGAARFSNPTGITAVGGRLYVADSGNKTIRQIIIATGEVTTLSGSAGVGGSTDGSAATALFSYPAGITNDGSYLYVADTDKCTIRRITIATGAVITVAGSADGLGSNDGIGALAQFNGPSGIAFDNGNLYVTDTNNNTIRKVVVSSSEVTTIAGNATALDSVGMVNASGTAARFNAPVGIASDGTNLYVADQSNNAIRKVTMSSPYVVSTLSGTTTNGTTDGFPAAARFDGPSGVVAGTGTYGSYLYVVDTNNNTIRQVIKASGVTSTISGSSATSGPTDGMLGSAALFDYPAGITADAAGTNLYVVDSNNNGIRKVVIATGVVTTVAGNGGTSGSTDSYGTFAQFSGPTDIAIDSQSQALYVTDSANHTIRKVTVAGTVTTVTGTVGVNGFTDGLKAVAQYNSPAGISVSADHTYLLLSDTGNNTIRKVIIATGTASTLAGTAGASGITDGTGTAALFSSPKGITTDGTNLFITDASNNTIRKVVIATRVVTTLAGAAGHNGADNGSGVVALFDSPVGITTDGTNLYVADYNNNTIRKVVISSGMVSTLAGSLTGLNGSDDGTGNSALFDGPSGLTTDGANLYVADSNNNVIRKIVISTGVVTTIAGSGDIGAVDGTGVAASFSNPVGITTDGVNLYVADASNNTVRRIVIASGLVTTLGNSGWYTSAGVNGTPLFNSPVAVSTDGTNLYVVDYGNILRKVTAAGVVSTVAGKSGVGALVDGAGSAAQFNYPTGITTDGTSLYVTDSGNNVIRVIK